MSAPKLLVLDRDGTLVDVVRDEETGTVSTAFHPSQLRLLPGVLDGLRRAHAAGCLLAIATNQPGPAKGQVSAAAVAATNGALVTMLADAGVPIAAVETCTHHPDGGPGGDARLVGPCACRKPLPGMILTILRRFAIAPADAWMVGDTGTDVQAGRAAQVRTALVFAAGRCELCPLRGGPSAHPDVFAPTFDAVVDAILGWVHEPQGG
ncbi:MAG: HAD-IIIA family hydrolase [Polyangiales bacterium]